MRSLGLAWRWAARAKTRRNFMQRDGVDPAYIEVYEAEACALDVAGEAPEAALVCSLLAKH
jgi:hypothetical protein